MENEKVFFSQVQAPEESNRLELANVKLQRNWVIWENYEAKSGEKLEWSKSIKQVYTFNDVLSFWQFWNNYPGANPSNIFYNGERMRYFYEEKLRIVGLNLFEEGVSPKWEDPRNNYGRTLTMQYTIKDDDLETFLLMSQNCWLKLMLLLLGESIESGKYINGIRFIDKTQFGRKIMYRYEVWVNKSIDLEGLEKLKELLTQTFGSTVEDKPIKV